MPDLLDPQPFPPAEAITQTSTDAEADVLSEAKPGLVSRALGSAVQLWLRSQLDSVDALQIQVESGNRQVLSGYIPQVWLKSRRAVYRGLHFSDVTVVGQNIRTNLSQVLRGKPLRLLEPLAVTLDVLFNPEDLNRSLGASLLKTALVENFLPLLRAHGGNQLVIDSLNAGPSSWELYTPHLVLGNQQIIFSGQFVEPTQNRAIEIAVRTGLRVGSPQELILDQPHWLPSADTTRGVPLPNLDGHTFDLGSEVQLQEVTITTSGLHCRGQIVINPT